MSASLPEELRQRLLKLPPVHTPLVQETIEESVAAVLVLLYPVKDQICFVLIRRPDYLRRHAGQIALPGGSAEPDDADYWETALRETREELGVGLRDARPLGRLPVVQARVSGFLIVPCVAWVSGRPRFRPDEVEVAETIQVTLGELLDPAALVDEVWDYREQRWNVRFYRLSGRVVWGITARILGSLVFTLRDPSTEELEREPGSVCPEGPG